MAVRSISQEELARAASAFLDEHHPSLALPIPIEHIVDTRLRLDIVPIPGLRRSSDTDRFITSDLGTIYIDQFVYQDRINRYRFTLAHEIAHLVLHGDFFREASFDSIAMWKRFIESLDPLDVARLEPQANSFAGLVLAPPSVLEEKFTEALHRVPPDLQRDANAGEIIDALASFLAPEFGVSQTTMQIRIGRQGLRPN